MDYLVKALAYDGKSVRMLRTQQIQSTKRREDTIRGQLLQLQSAEP